MSFSSSFAEAPTSKKPVSCTGGDGQPLSFIDEDTIVYADEPGEDDPNLKIMALKQRIDVLEEEKKWLEWRLRKWQDCHECSKCKHEKQEEKEDEAIVVKSSARIMEVSSHGNRMTRHQSRSYIYSWIHCNDMDLPDGVLKKRLNEVSLLDATVLYGDEEGDSDTEEKLVVPVPRREFEAMEERKASFSFCIHRRIPVEELATSGPRITPWPVRDACSATELRLADREAQARVYVWDWPESPHGLSPRHIEKSELGRLVSELNVGKGLAQFSVFYRRLPSGPVNARFIVKYWGSRRWVKMSQTLRTVYGIHASTLQGSRGSLNYDSLFNDCLLGDPEPLLSPNHPPVPLPDYIPTI
ncbi:hypothetical protein FOZ60_005535 [Perkinsus olseni]|uniref:Uncharacterized protein n=1 Tax=Perkinsus olseni TaxID=32597 RepID=A0A7J6PIL3_PEROL|nr:hypothetical protein FOZ60_005535 [Perkinsus olseni]